MHIVKQTGEKHLCNHVDITWVVKPDHFLVIADFHNSLKKYSEFSFLNTVILNTLIILFPKLVFIEDGSTLSFLYEAILHVNIYVYVENMLMYIMLHRCLISVGKLFNS